MSRRGACYSARLWPGRRVRESAGTRSSARSALAECVSVPTVSATSAASGVELSAPQQLFPISDPQLLNSFAISPDGQRFLFVRSAGNDRVSVILNWAAHLDELARSQ